MRSVGYCWSGTTFDNGTVTQVLVNDVPATSVRPNFTEWTVTVAKSDELTAFARDQVGNVEPRPHRLSQ